MTDEPTALDVAQDRLKVAHEAFDEVNTVLPPGLLPFQLPLILETTAAGDALVQMLIAKGLIDEQEFVAGKLTRQAELVEDCTEQAKTAKGRVSHLVLTQGL